MAAASDDPRPTSQVVADIIDDTRALLRQEVELAKLELTEAMQAKAQALAALAVAGVLALFAVLFGAVAAGMALSEVLAPWLAWLVVAAAFALVAGLAAVFAAGRGRTPVEPVRTTQTIKENVEWARQRLTR